MKGSTLSPRTTPPHHTGLIACRQPAGLGEWRERRTKIGLDGTGSNDVAGRMVERLHGVIEGGRPVGKVGGCQCMAGNVRNGIQAMTHGSGKIEG